jgi:biopolymer transport protein ExbB
MSFNLGHIINDMGLFALLIVGALGAMGIASLTVCVERLYSFWKTRKRSIEFGGVAMKYLDENDLDGLAREAGEHKNNHLARLLGAGAATYMKNVDISGELGPVELARRDMARQGETVNAKLRRGMGIVASVGSTAPFTGLLGTVVGIIEAFQGIAAEGSGGLGAVSAGISEALVVTALGLVVAIPSVLVFNLLSAQADGLELALDQARGEFVDHIEKQESMKKAEKDALLNIEATASAA